jgi:hypothetical protein
MGFVWSHDKDDSEYWNELSTLHSLVRYGVWAELLLSCSIIGLLFVDYKQSYGNYLNPISLNYENKNKCSKNLNLLVN